MSPLLIQDSGIAQEVERWGIRFQQRVIRSQIYMDHVVWFGNVYF
jgi:hypothetical protein